MVNGAGSVAEILCSLELLRFVFPTIAWYSWRYYRAQAGESEREQLLAREKAARAAAEPTG